MFAKPKTPKTVAHLAIAAAIIISAGCAVPKNYSNGQPRYSGSFDNKHRKNGSWKFFYFDGTRRCVGSYKGGKRDGAWTWFYPNGKLRRVLSFESHLPIGQYVEYNDKGTLIAKGTFIRGKKSGTWELYDATGRLMATLAYLDGKLSGKSVFTTRMSGNETWKSYEQFSKGKREKAKVVTPEGKTLKFVIKQNKTVFPWKNGSKTELADKFLVLRKADMHKITALLAKEGKLIRDAERRFSPHYDFPRDPRPKR